MQEFDRRVREVYGPSVGLSALLAPVFAVYNHAGTPAELKAQLAAQGANIRVDGLPRASASVCECAFSG